MSAVGPRANEAAARAPDRPDEDSQLGLLRRIRLYARKPRDAFAVTSSRERRIDARWIFALYFVVKAPVLLQRAAALGHLEKHGVVGWALAFSVGLLGGVVLSLLMFLVAGAFLHLLLNVFLRCGRSFGDAVRLPILSLAPQLLLVVEYPSLIFDFGSFDTFAVFALLRLVVDVLSFRAFYWGLRSLFRLSTGRALAVLLLAALPVALLSLAALTRR